MMSRMTQAESCNEQGGRPTPVDFKQTALETLPCRQWKTERTRAEDGHCQGRALGKRLRLPGVEQTDGGKSNRAAA